MGHSSQNQCGEIGFWFGKTRVLRSQPAALTPPKHDLRQRAMRDQGRYDVPVLPGVRYRRAHHMCVPPLSHLLVPFLRLLLFSHPLPIAPHSTLRVLRTTTRLRQKCYAPASPPPLCHASPYPCHCHHNATVFSSPLASVPPIPVSSFCGRLVLQLRRPRPRRSDAEPRPRVARGRRLRPPLDTPRVVVPAMRVHRPRDTTEALG